MKLSSLFKKTLVGQVILFSLVTVSMSVASAYSLRWHLTGEYSSRGSAIAKGIADSSPELLESDSPETFQAIVDESADLRGVAYIFVLNANGTIVAHTFEGPIPKQFLNLTANPALKAAKEAGSTRTNMRRFTHSPNFEGGKWSSLRKIPQRKKFWIRHRYFCADSRGERWICPCGDGSNPTDCTHSIGDRPPVSGDFPLVRFERNCHLHHGGPHFATASSAD